MLDPGVIKNRLKADLSLSYIGPKRTKNLASGQMLSPQNLQIDKWGSSSGLSSHKRKLEYLQLDIKQTVNQFNFRSTTYSDWILSITIWSKFFNVSVSVFCHQPFLMIYMYSLNFDSKFKL